MKIDRTFPVLKILSVASDLVEPYGEVPTVTIIVAHSDTSKHLFFNRFGSLPNLVGEVLLLRLSEVIDRRLQNPRYFLDNFVRYAGEYQNYLQILSDGSHEKLANLFISRMQWQDDTASEYAKVAVMALLHSYHHINVDRAIDIIQGYLEVEPDS